MPKITRISICFFHNRCAKLKLLYRTNKVFFILLMIFDELRVKFQIDLETFLSNKILNQHVCLTQFATLNRYNKLFLSMKILPYLQELICSIFILFRNKTSFNMLSLQKWIYKKIKWRFESLLWSMIA